jgi:RNA polymerase sigma-70 factor (ECF subfamily)
VPSGAEAIRRDPRGPTCADAFEAEVDFVYRMLRRLGVGGADAEDLAQEVFLVMWRRWGDYDPGRPLRPWLAGIAFRVVCGHRKRLRPEEPAGLVDAPDPGRLVDDELAAARARALVRDALASLPDKQQAILVLHELEGLAMTDIALSLAEPLTTLYSRLVTARRALARSVRRMARAPGMAAVPVAAGLAALARTAEAAPAEARARICERVRALAEGPPPATAATPAPRPSGPGMRAGRALSLGAGAVLVLGALVYVQGRPPRNALRAATAGTAAERGERPESTLRRTAGQAAGRPGLLVGGQPEPPLSDPHPGLREGLVGDWRFDDVGTATALDHSGNATDCALRGPEDGTEWSQGRRGGAIAIIGKGWLECPHPRFGRAPDLTVAAWVLRTRAQKGMRALVTRQLGATNRDHFFFGFIDDDLTISSHVWNGPLRYPVPAAVGRWVHVAAVHRDGLVKLFVDGTQVAERNSYRGRSVDTDAPLLIGAGANGPDPAVTTQRFAGALDELLVYRRALADEEIAALADGARPGL